MPEAHAPAMHIYRTLHQAYGPQHWWPADTPFEVMVGALLTQNTNWKNVEKAIAQLKHADLLHAASIISCPIARLEALIRPSGYFRQKAGRLQGLCRFYVRHGELAGLQNIPTDQLRHMLLELKGIGPETADSILLYALDRPLFVIDAYTRRIFARLGLCSPRYRLYRSAEADQRTASRGHPPVQRIPRADRRARQTALPHQTRLSSPAR